MQYPIIKYSVIRSRLQTKNDCAIFAMCRYFEQLARLMGHEAEFKAKDLEQPLLDAGKKRDDFGTNMRACLKYLMDNKIDVSGYKVGWWNYIGTRRISSLRLKLARKPFLISLRCVASSKKRIVNGYWENKKSRKKIGYHLVLCLGWNGVGFVIQDSHYHETYILRPAELLRDCKAIYTVRLNKST